jgi:hypothetical protein
MELLSSTQAGFGSFLHITHPVLLGKFNQWNLQMARFASTVALAALVNP